MIMAEVIPELLLVVSSFHPCFARRPSEDRSAGLGCRSCIGVVGSVVPLAMLAVAVLLYVKRQKQGGGNQPRPYSKEVDYEAQPVSPISPTGTALYVSPL